MRIFCVMLAALVFAGSPSVSMGQKAKTPAKKAATAMTHDVLVEAQLRAFFGRTDLNKDGFLDAAELAKAFRGPSAKPAPMPEYDDQGSLKNAVTSTTAKYPDQIYLLAMDKNGDDRVDWEELDAYGEAYAAQLKNTQAANQQAMSLAVAQAQRNLAVRRNVGYSRNSSRYGHRRTSYSHSRNRQVASRTRR